MTRRVLPLFLGLVALTAGPFGCRGPRKSAETLDPCHGEAQAPPHVPFDQQPTPIESGPAGPAPVPRGVTHQGPAASNPVLLPGGRQDSGPRLGPVAPQDDPLFHSGLPPILVSQPPPGGDSVVPVQPTVVERTGAPRPEPLVEALRCMLENQHSQALEALKGYDAKTQEVFLQILPALALLAHKKLNDLTPAEAAAFNEQLQNLLAAVRPRTELVIGRMCFCEWVKSYGVYKPLAENHVFQAGVANQPGEQARLYVELYNVCSERRDPYHETRLASSVEITDARGTRVWYYRFDDRSQPLRSWTRVHDYYNNYTFHVPHIPPGLYTLTIQVTDETLPDQKRSAKKSVPFQVTSGR